MPDGPTINPSPAALPPDLLEYFSTLPTATLGQVSDEGFVDPDVRSLLRGVRIVGTAVTLKLPAEDRSLVGRAAERLRPGDILVIDHGGESRSACWGELLSLVAGARGCAGVVVDGAVSGVSEIVAQGMPTFARAVSALMKRTAEPDDGGINVPVQCGGVAVHPGDLIVGDDDGIVVIPPARTADVGARARALADALPYRRAWVRHGGPLTDLDGRSAAEIYRMLQERGWT